MCCCHVAVGALQPPTVPVGSRGAVLWSSHLTSSSLLETLNYLHYIAVRQGGIILLVVYARPWKAKFKAELLDLTNDFCQGTRAGCCLGASRTGATASYSILQHRWGRDWWPQAGLTLGPGPWAGWRRPPEWVWAGTVSPVSALSFGSPNRKLWELGLVISSCSVGLHRFTM